MPIHKHASKYIRADTLNTSFYTISKYIHTDNKQINMYTVNLSYVLECSLGLAEQSYL